MEKPRDVSRRTPNTGGFIESCQAGSLPVEIQQILTCRSCVPRVPAEVLVNLKKHQISWNFAPAMSLLDMFGSVFENEAIKSPDFSKSGSCFFFRDFTSMAGFALASG